MTTLKDRKVALEKRLADLEARMNDIAQEFDSHDAKDWEEMAVEREGDEVLEDLGNSAQQEVRMIKAALGRIDEGDYGLCTKCGTEISTGRLDVLPYTPFCKDCAS